jgi:alpha-glucuronidase
VRIWGRLHYVLVSDKRLLDQYRRSVTTVIVENADQNQVYRHTPNLSMERGSSEKLVNTPLEAARDELVRGLGVLLGRDVQVKTSPGNDIPNGSVIVGTPSSSWTIQHYIAADALASIGDEGYIIRSLSRGSSQFTVIAGNTEVAALYGTFAFLRLMQTQKPIVDLDITETPRVKHRALDNWETTRLYAGNNATGTGGLNGENGTIFDFAATGASAARNLPVILDRYIVVARALASLGINSFEINLVNADNVYLTPAYIE